MATPQPNQNAMIPAQDAPETLAAYIRKPEVIERFADALGSSREAMVFVQSVLILVQNSDPGEYSLQNCSHQSIVRSALRAVTLRVSVDPALRQAWLVPRKNKKSGKLEACLQLHYAEVRNRAMRTGRYWSINVSPVYEGEVVMEHPITGLNAIMFPNGSITFPVGSRDIIKGKTDGWVPVDSRGKKVIGWFGFSETTRGAMQTVYMSIGDIEKHISAAQSWGTGTDSWKKHRQTMERKTVLLALLRKEDLGAPELEKIRGVLAEAEDTDAIQAHDEPIEEEITGEYTEVEPQKITVTPPAKKNEQATTTEPTRPYTPEILREKFASIVAALEANPNTTITPVDRQIVAKTIKAVFNGDDTQRYTACRWLVGVASTKEMSAAQIRALMKITGVKDFEGIIDPNALTELRQVYAAAIVAEGQQSLPMTEAQKRTEAQNLADLGL